MPKRRSRVIRSPAPLPPPPASAPAPEPAPLRVAAVLFGALLAVYTLNFRVLSGGDSAPIRLLPFSIIMEGDFDLDEFSWQRFPDGRYPYYLQLRGEHLYSTSPIVTAVLVTPLYLLPSWWLAAHAIPFTDVRAHIVAVAVERVAAATISALSAAVLSVALRRLVPWRWALSLTLLYALGTSTWAISSQALWPHALAELSLSVLCAILLAPQPSAAALMLAGAAAAVGVANRLQMLVFAVPAALFIWRYHRRQAAAFLVLPVAGAAALAVYNLSLFAGLTGSYGGFRHFHTPLFEGLAGMLVSPSRGLFVYTPVMLFAAIGGVRVWRVTSPPWLRFLAVGVLLHMLLYAKFAVWWGGYCFGPRYMTDALPALTLLLVYGLVPWWRWQPVRVIAVALAVYGIVVQAIGVYWADDRWHREPVPIEVQPQRVWDWSDLQITRALENGWRGTELAAMITDAFRDAVPAYLTPLTVQDLASSFETIDFPSAMPPGGRGSLHVRLTNRGQRSWSAFSGEANFRSQYLTVVVLRWFSQGALVAGAGDVIYLPENLSPAETVELELPLVAPQRTGDYHVEVRVSQVADGTGGLAAPDALTVPIRVVRSRLALDARGHGESSSGRYE